MIHKVKTIRTFNHKVVTLNVGVVGEWNKTTRRVVFRGVCPLSPPMPGAHFALEPEELLANKEFFSIPKATLKFLKRQTGEL